MNNTNQSTIPEGHVEGLPDNLQPFAIEIAALRARHAKAAAELAETKRKRLEAEGERKELQASGPPNEGNVRALIESHIRVELYTNHERTLETVVSEIMQRGVTVTAGTSRELQKIAVEVEVAARNQFFATVGRLVVNNTAEIGYTLNNPFGPLRSREEELARVLKATVQYSRMDGDPFVAFDELIEAWEEFSEQFTALQAAKRELAPA